MCALLCRYRCQHAPSTTPQKYSTHIYTDNFITNFNNLTINVDQFRSKARNSMDQIITTLRIQEGSSVTIMDRRRIWWNGLVECPDGYKYTSPLGTAGMVPPADGSHGTRYDPSRRSFTIVLIPREFSPPKSKQEAGPSERAEEPETNGESSHESRTPTCPTRAPSNLDPNSGNYRAFVKFMDGKKLSEVKLREHLETFGPLGPYLKPSSVNNRNVSYRSILRLVKAAADLLPLHV